MPGDLLVSDPEAGSKVLALLESIKRYLWHGNVVAALEHIDNCVMYCDDPELSYPSLKSLQNIWMKCIPTSGIIR